jgi:hypothetical protein
VRLDDLVRPLLLPNNLKNVLIIALDGRRSDYQGRFQAFEFAGAASQFTIVRRTGKEVTLLKDWSPPTETATPTLTILNAQRAGAPVLPVSPCTGYNSRCLVLHGGLRAGAHADFHRDCRTLALRNARAH